MSLVPPEKVEKLQAALHAKAKRSPNYRFYQLYDKLYRSDVLWFAYRRCLANDGAAGVDHETFEDIATYGEQRWLDELAEELYHRPLLFAEDGTSLYRHTSVSEEGHAVMPRDQRNDQLPMDAQGCPRPRGENQPETDRLVDLLLSGPREQSLPNRGSSRVS
jgi:hypothetical protein